MSTPRPTRWPSAGHWPLRLLGWTGACLLLLAVWGLYQRPDFLLQMADQLWSCF